MNKKENKIAFKLSLDAIITKEDFIEFLLSSIKTVHFIIEDNVIIASKDNEEDLDIQFIELKNKINQWMKEESHTEPFYPRSFIKRILKSGVTFDYVDRKDDPNKMKPENYGLDNVSKMKKFILSRIDKDNEKTGLKFKENKMQISNGMPLDVYNAFVININSDKEDKIYIKFSVNKELSDAYFNMNFISIHKDKGDL